MQVRTRELDQGGGGVGIWLRAALLLMALGGLAYPAAATLLGGALFPWQAQGSLIERDGVLVGSARVGQPFSGAGYVIPRPSAADYDPTRASGSNLAASNPDLRARAEETSRRIARREGAAVEHIPVDLIAASGSGLDPHISPAAARLQAPRQRREPRAKAFWLTPKRQPLSSYPSPAFCSRFKTAGLVRCEARSSWRVYCLK